MFFSVWHWNDFFHHYRKQYVTIIKRLNRIVDGHWYQQRVERELFTHGPGNDGTLTCTTLNWSERQEPWKCVLIAGMPDDPACKNARFINILISLGRMWHWPPAKECNLQKGNVPHCFYTSSWSCISREGNGPQSHGTVFVITSRRKAPQSSYFFCMQRLFFDNFVNKRVGASANLHQIFLDQFPNAKHCRRPWHEFGFP